MPPHCDALDGPVVTAARQALEDERVELVLPYVPEDAEAEVRAAYDRVLPVLGLGDDARAVAERWFFETVVRLHRAGEGASFTGLKPAGLSAGPAIPLAEKAIRTGSVRPLARFLTGVLNDELALRLERVNDLAATQHVSVRDGRRYVEAMLGFEVYSHHVLQALQAPAHG